MQGLHCKKKGILLRFLSGEGTRIVIIPPETQYPDRLNIPSDFMVINDCLFQSSAVCLDF